MNKNIGKKTIVSSFIFKFTEKIGTKIFGFVISVILARMLNPEVFGVLAIFLAIVAIMETFVDSGLSIALIQNKTTEEKDYSTIFFVSFGIAVIIYILLYFSTPLILSFFNMEGYEKQLRILLIIILFYSFNSIQGAQLTKGMRFKEILICQLVSTILSGAVAIVFAYMGFGIWTLIIYYVSNSIFSCVSYSFVAKWHPQLYFSFERAKVFLDFGLKVLASNLLTQLFAQIRTFTVGKLYTAVDLAYYNRGDQVPSIISSTINSVFKSVMLPVYADRQDEKEKLLYMLRTTISLNSFIIFPAMFGLSAIAYEMVIILYTAKWAFCVPFVRILSLANLSIAITSPCLVLIQALGKGDVYFKLELSRRVMMIIILIGSIFFNSLIAIAVGWLISSFLDVIMVVWTSKDLFRYTFSMLIEDIFPNFVASIGMFFAVYFLSKLGIAIGFKLVIQLAIGVVTYLGLSVLLKNQNLKSVLELVGNYKNKLKNE